MNNPAWPATAQAAEHELFGDVLTCDAVLPASYLADATARTAQAEALLQGLAQVEDLRGSEDSGEEKRGELPLLAQRLDAKLDLVLVLLGRLVRQANPPTPPCRSRTRPAACACSRPTGCPTTSSCRRSSAPPHAGRRPAGSGCASPPCPRDWRRPWAATCSACTAARSPTPAAARLEPRT